MIVGFETELSEGGVRMGKGGEEKKKRHVQNPTKSAENH